MKVMFLKKKERRLMTSFYVNQIGRASCRERVLRLV